MDDNDLDEIAEDLADAIGLALEQASDALDGRKLNGPGRNFVSRVRRAVDTFRDAER